MSRSEDWVPPPPGTPRTKAWADHIDSYPVAEMSSAAEQLQAEKLRYARARADILEMEANIKRDEERDRMVGNGRVRVLNINDVILPDTAVKYIGALIHWERRDPGEPISVLLNSPGGSMTHGLAIYDTIQRLRRKGHTVTTHGSGMVASMAAVLLQAGDTRILDQRAKLLIHEGSQTFSQNISISAAEMEDHQFLTKMLRNDVLSILAERATLTREELEEKWKRRDWYLDAEEALEYGFIDRVE